MFIPAGGYLLNTVEFGTAPDVFVAHGGWVGSWELWQQPFQLMQEYPNTMRTPSVRSAAENHDRGRVVDRPLRLKSSSTGHHA